MSKFEPFINEKESSRKSMTSIDYSSYSYVTINYNLHLEIRYGHVEIIFKILILITKFRML